MSQVSAVDGDTKQANKPTPPDAAVHITASGNADRLTALQFCGNGKSGHPDEYVTKMSEPRPVYDPKRLYTSLLSLNGSFTLPMRRTRTSSSMELELSIDGSNDPSKEAKKVGEPVDKAGRSKRNN